MYNFQRNTFATVCAQQFSKIFFSIHLVFLLFYTCILVTINSTSSSSFCFLFRVLQSLQVCIIIINTFTNTIWIWCCCRCYFSFSISTQSYTAINRYTASLCHPLYFFSNSIRRFNDDLSELEYIIHTVNKDVFIVRCLRAKIIHSNSSLSSLHFIIVYLLFCDLLKK